MTTNSHQRTPSSSRHNRTALLTDLVNVLNSPGIYAERVTHLTYDSGINLFVNGYTVLVKTPTTERSNICVELLRETANGNWEMSWALTNKCLFFLWLLPEGKHLWVERESLIKYLEHERNLLVLTNHNTSTRNRLREANLPSNVITTWLSIENVIDNCTALRYDVGNYNSEALSEWLTLSL